MFVGRSASLFPKLRKLSPKLSLFIYSHTTYSSVQPFSTFHWRLLDTKKSEEVISKHTTNESSHTGYEKDEHGYVHFQSIRNNHLFFTIPFTKTKIRWIYLIAFLVLGVITNLILLIEEAPVTHRKRLLLLSNSFLMGEADSIFKQFKTAALPTSHPDHRLVLSLGVGIARACQSLQDDLPKWEFIVVESDEANAFALPNGKVVVFSGLLEALERNPDRIAGVMSHEIAHVLMEHGREGATFSSLIHIVSFLIRSVYTFRVPSSLLNIMLELPHSREQEYEADLIGTLLMVRANYKPLGLAEGFEKLSSLDASPTSEYLSTHPSFEHRIERIKKFAVKAVELQKKERIKANSRQIRQHWYDGFEDL